jgi:integrase
MKILSRTTRKINGRWYARIRYEDNNGNKRELLRHSEVNTKTDAKTLRVKLETELLEKGPTELVAGKITFRQLVEYAKTTRYMEASYDSNGAVVSGIRGAKKAHSVLNQLVRFFGDKDIRKIDGDLLEHYKVARINGLNGTSKVELATVHRQLSTARALFNMAIRKKWLTENPFSGRPDLIQTAAETPSPLATRAMTEQEAQRVMEALNTPERIHTLPIFIAVMDTGVRRSSLLDHLRWQDVYFDEELIIVTAYKRKNKQQWPVPMTSRLKKELLKLRLQRKNNNPEALVFEQAMVNLRKLWKAAYSDAGVPEGTRMFYSVRHAFATEMANSGVELPELARLLGHSSVNMSYRYYNLTEKTINKVRNILNNRIATA